MTKLPARPQHNVLVWHVGVYSASFLLTNCLGKPTICQREICQQDVAGLKSLQTPDLGSTQVTWGRHCLIRLPWTVRIKGLFGRKDVRTVLIHTYVFNRRGRGGMKCGIQLKWYDFRSYVWPRSEPLLYVGETAPFDPESKAMGLSQITLAVAVFVAAFSAHGGQPAGPPLASSQPPGRAASDALARFRFAPMWRPVPKFPRVSDAEAALPVPSATYAMIWQPQWQEEIGISAEQKETLLAINAKAVAEARDHSEEFKKLSPVQRQAEVKSWAGKPAPWRQQLNNKIRTQIEAVLTPQQLQTLKEFSFPRCAVGLLYDAETRREIGFGPQQEDQLRRIAEERLARFQAVSIEQAEKQWGMLTPEQQAALPEVVKRQGPTSAILSIAWELGFDLDSLVPGYPMLAAAPVRERLGLSAKQEEQLNAVTAESAARREKTRQERLSGKTPSSDAPLKWEAAAKMQVEAILTPQQLTTFNEIDFRRKVALALGYPEKREKVRITEQQSDAFQRLDKGNHERRYRIDCEMLARALEALTPRQQEQLREEIDRRFYGESGPQR